MTGFLEFCNTVLCNIIINVWQHVRNFQSFLKLEQIATSPLQKLFDLSIVITAIIAPVSPRK